MNTVPMTKDQLRADIDSPLGSQATAVERSRAIAEVQAMVVVARHQPRSEADAINRVLEACGQMYLAERAFFKFPRGGSTVSGASIHLAVELARCWGNIDYGVKEMSRDDVKGESEMIAYAWDVQTNARSVTSFIVPHKRDKKGGAEWLTDMRDIYENNANNAARRLREMIFRVIPSYIKVQAEDACRKTLARQNSEKPMAQRIADCLYHFEQIGVSRKRIEAKIGMSADQMTVVDLANLGVSLRSIRNNEVTIDEEFPLDMGEEIQQQLKSASGGTEGAAPKKENGAPKSEPSKKPTAPAKKAEPKKAPAQKAPEPEPEPETAHDPETGEVIEDEGEPDLPGVFGAGA